MDVRSKADYINMAASESVKICQACQSVNDADANFCVTCGEDLPSVDSKNEIGNGEMAFSTVDETAATEERFQHYQEPESVFAEGLPEWTLEPPQMIVRRRR